MFELRKDGRTASDESARTELMRQRALSERFLLAALEARDASGEAISAGRRATFLASASRDLALSLNDEGARETIRRRTFMRDGSWCIVDVIEKDGVIHRLPVAHPDPEKQESARVFADHWFPMQAGFAVNKSSVRVVDANTAHGLQTVRDFGFGGLLVVPLVARTTVLGAITFVAREADAPFSPQEITLASDLADLCALALDNERLYREARELREAANVASRAKSSFLGNMSHELMTPLNAIGGYVSLMEMGLRGPVSAEQLVDLGRIRHHQVHLLTLISDVLTFVRSESAQLEYRLSAVSARSALRDVVDMLQGAADKQLSIVDSPGDADAEVWADPDRVRQILLNLVMNAVKYTTTPDAGIVLSVTATPEDVAINVADSGPGIPAKQLAAIFDPFVQLPSGLSNRRGGVGLGLAISRDLARAMNGNLTVESTLGVGSRFTLRLPRAPGPP